MSASPMARQAVESKAITIKRVLINDATELPSHYSSTPGGTLFSTTPGGTRIVYEKSYLMNLRNSPISKTPPTFDIPEQLCLGGGSPTRKANHKNGAATPKAHSQRGGPPKRNWQNKQTTHKKSNDLHEDQFQIEL